MSRLSQTQYSLHQGGRGLGFEGLNSPKSLVFIFALADIMFPMWSQIKSTKIQGREYPATIPLSTWKAMI